MDSSVLSAITGGAGALVVLALVAWAFYAGKLHSNREFSKLEAENVSLKAALELERTAVDEQAGTGTVTNQLIRALVLVASSSHENPSGPRVIDSHPLPAREHAQLTGEDLGL